MSDPDGAIKGGDNPPLRAGMHPMVRMVYALPTLPLFIWGVLALYWGSWPRPLCLVLLFIYIAAHLLSLMFARKRRIFLFCLAAFSLPLLSFFLMSPSNDRNWQQDASITSYGVLNGDILTLHNVRNNSYQTETDYVTRYETREYDLSRLKSVDVMLTDWGLKYIAHTMVSFGFEGGKYLCFSVETRKENGESYSALKGFFRQYELIYIAGDERDLVKLRTNYRQGEDVYLYRYKVFEPEKIRLLLMEYISRINALHDKPQWYNALTENCMTSVFRLARKHVVSQGGGKWHWSIILNGFADRHAYEKGTIDTSLPFDELKRVSRINDRALAAGDSPDFSNIIREGLPGMLPHSDERNR